MELAGAKVDWMLRWANDPHLEIWMEGPEPDWSNRIWNFLPGVPAEPASAEQLKVIGGASNYNGNFLICREVPLVSFIFESVNGGGALGGTFKLTDGREYKTKGGWSSNPGTVNELRKKDARFREILPEPVCDISLFRDWSSDKEPGEGKNRFERGHTALATHADLSLAEEAIERFLPGVAMIKNEYGSYVPGLADGRRKPDPSEQIALDERARVR
jgi:hypothetical protein